MPLILEYVKLNKIARSRAHSERVCHVNVFRNLTQWPLEDFNEIEDK